MRKYLLPALLAVVAGMTLLPSSAQASWLSEALRNTRVEFYPGGAPVYVPPVYATPVYASPYATPLYPSPTYVPSITPLPAAGYYVSPSYSPYRYDVYPPLMYYPRHENHHHHHDFYSYERHYR